MNSNNSQSALQQAWNQIGQGFSGLASRVGNFVQQNPTPVSFIQRTQPQTGNLLKRTGDISVGLLRLANEVNPVQAYLDALESQNREGNPNFIKNRRQEIGNQIFGNFQPQLRQVNNFVQQYPSPSSFVQKSVIPQINDFRTDLPANLAYLKAKGLQSTGRLQALPTAREMFNVSSTGEPITPLPSKVSSLKPNFNSEEAVKSMSAESYPWMVPANTPYNQQLEKMKQNIISNSGFRPAMQRYLSNVPLYGYYEDPKNYQVPKGETPWFTGEAGVTPKQVYDNQGIKPEVIKAQQEQRAFNKSLPWELAQGPKSDQRTLMTGVPQGQPVPNDNDYKKLILHELTHAAPRNMQYRNEFIRFFNKLTPENNPRLWSIGLMYYNNGKPPPNPEEFYATVAEELGPKVLNDPEIRKFYENVFQTTNTKGYSIKKRTFEAVTKRLNEPERLPLKVK